MKKLLIGMIAVVGMSFYACEEDTAFEDNPIYNDEATGDNPKLPGDGSGGTGGTGGSGGGGNSGPNLTLTNTELQKRVAVLEDFTGVKCQFCPDGTRRAETIEQQYGDGFIMIATHGGGFAAPGGGVTYPTGDTIFFPDLRTIFAAPLISEAGVNSYPAGSMNRLHVQNDFGLSSSISPPLGMGRGNWATTAAQVRALDAPVNVGAKATVDGSRNLTVEVELYYTAEETEKNFINVAILQDGVMGLQIDIINNQVVRDSGYVHNDMLRHYVTGQWGQEITDPTTVGSVVRETFTYTIPDKFVNDPVNNKRGEGDAIIDDLSVVVFVSREKVNILNATEVDVE